MFHKITMLFVVLMIGSSSLLTAQKKAKGGIDPITLQKAEAYNVDPSRLKCFTTVMKVLYQAKQAEIYSNMDRYKADSDKEQLGFKMKYGRNLIEKYFITMAAYKKFTEKEQKAVATYYKGYEAALGIDSHNYNKEKKKICKTI